MKEHRTHILDNHGDLLEGWFLHTHGWMHASNTMVGITRAKPRMSQMLAFTSVRLEQREKQGEWIQIRVANIIYTIINHWAIIP
ncbi:hypothetical protein LguiB_013630 [Lonicera macranthoides]